jgi:hypothetical protein
MFNVTIIYYIHEMILSLQIFNIKQNLISELHSRYLIKSILLTRKMGS